MPCHSYQLNGHIQTSFSDIIRLKYCPNCLCLCHLSLSQLTTRETLKQCKFNLLWVSMRETQCSIVPCSAVINMENRAVIEKNSSLPCKQSSISIQMKVDAKKYHAQRYAISLFVCWSWNHENILMWSRFG